MGKETKKKKEVSEILKAHSTDWHNAKDVVPEAGKHVAIRFVNRRHVYDENDKEIYYVEDEKIGTFLRDINDPDNIASGRWSIDPPYPKYDYSPIAKDDKLLEGTIVTHWREVSEEDLERYRTRFSLANASMKDYGTLKLEVDREHEEVVYRALLWGASSLGRLAGKNEMMLALHGILYDLTYCIDSDEYIENGKVHKFHALKDPEVEDPEGEEELIRKLSKEEIVKATLELTAELAKVYTSNEEDSEKVQTKLLYEYMKNYNISNEECESLMSIIKKIENTIKGIKPAAEDFMNPPVEPEEGSEVYDELHKMATEGFKDINLEDFDVRPENIDAAMGLIKKFQEEMEYRIIDGEAYHRIDMFNNDMSGLGVPLRAVLDKEHGKVTIKPTKRLADALSQNEYKSGTARLVLIRYPRFAVSMIEKGLLKPGEYDEGLYKSSKEYYDNLEKGIIPKEESEGDDENDGSE